MKVNTEKLRTIADCLNKAKIKIDNSKFTYLSIPNVFSYYYQLANWNNSMENLKIKAIETKNILLQNIERYERAEENVKKQADNLW